MIFADSPWNAVDRYAIPFNRTTMLTGEEQYMLYFLTSQHYIGAGSIIDAGCFLGGSTIAMAKGLADSRKQGVVHSYDWFVAEPHGMKFMGGQYQLGENFLPMYLRHIEPYKEHVQVHAGDFLLERCPAGPVEILFADVCKTAALNDHMAVEFFPNLAEGSILVQQDYFFGSLPWIHITMASLRDHFEVAGRTERNSRLYRCTRPISKSQALAACWGTMTNDLRRERMNEAIAELTGADRDFLVQAKASVAALRDPA